MAKPQNAKHKTASDFFPLAVVHVYQIAFYKTFDIIFQTNWEHVFLLLYKTLSFKVLKF